MGSERGKEKKEETHRGSDVDRREDVLLVRPLVICKISQALHPRFYTVVYLCVGKKCVCVCDWLATILM